MFQKNHVRELGLEHVHIPVLFLFPVNPEHGQHWDIVYLLFITTPQYATKCIVNIALLCCFTMRALTDISCAFSKFLIVMLVFWAFFALI